MKAFVIANVTLYWTDSNLVLKDLCIINKADFSMIGCSFLISAIILHVLFNKIHYICSSKFNFQSKNKPTTRNDPLPFKTTLCWQFLKKSFKRYSSLSFIMLCFNLYLSPWCYSLWKAFYIKKIHLILLSHYQ